MRRPHAGRAARWGQVHQGLPLLRATMTLVRGGRLVRWTVVLVVLVAWLAGPARATETGWIEEGRIGVLAHDIRVFGLGRPANLAPTSISSSCSPRRPSCAGSGRHASISACQ